MAIKKKASNSEILKQVLFEMLTLAYAIELLTKNKWIKGTSHIDSSEVIQVAAALKLRILYDFLYNRKPDPKIEPATDFFSAQDDFNVVLKKPAFSGLDPSGMFTRESVNKYIVYFSEERITKPKELAPPRFKGGTENLIGNSALILASGEKFIDALAKSSFMNLNQESENYLKDFKQTVIRLKENPNFMSKYK